MFRIIPPSRLEHSCSDGVFAGAEADLAAWIERQTERIVARLGS